MPVPMIYKVLNPLGVLNIESAALSPPIDSLKGKTIGLGWNQKAKGDIFDDELENLIKDRVKGIKIIRFSGYAVPANIKEMNAVIFGVGD